MDKEVLGGIRILDFTIQEQGPVATQMLAELGAEVSMMERAGEGDPLRGDGKSSVNGVSAQGEGFIAFNRNKKSIAIDLKDPRAVAIVKRFVGDTVRPMYFHMDQIQLNKGNGDGGSPKADPWEGVITPT